MLRKRPNQIPGCLLGAWNSGRSPFLKSGLPSNSEITTIHASSGFIWGIPAESPGRRRQPNHCLSEGTP